jgi:hypothetical protein
LGLRAQLPETRFGRLGVLTGRVEALSASTRSRRVGCAGSSPRVVRGEGSAHGPARTIEAVVPGRAVCRTFAATSPRRTCTPYELRTATRSNPSRYMLCTTRRLIFDRR